MQHQLKCFALYDVYMLPYHLTEDGGEGVRSRALGGSGEKKAPRAHIFNISLNQHVSTKEWKEVKGQSSGLCFLRTMQHFARLKCHALWGPRQMEKSATTISNTHTHLAFCAAWFSALILTCSSELNIINLNYNSFAFNICARGSRLHHRTALPALRGLSFGHLLGRAP